MENVWADSGLSNHIGLTQGQESNFSFSTYIQSFCILGDMLFLEAISRISLHPPSVKVFFFSSLDEARQQSGSSLMKSLRPQTNW